MLGSRWSAVGPVPVSVFAVGGYLSILGVLIASGRWAGGRWVLAGLGAALLGAAVWYTALQAFVIVAWCPYCLVGHGVGAVLGGVLISRISLRRWPAPVGCGVCAVLVLVGGQVLIPANGKRITLPVAGDYDLTEGGERYLGLIGGGLGLTLPQTPHHGRADAPNVVVVLFDYACPHCRETHELLERQRGLRDDLVVLALPVSLHTSRNPHIAVDDVRFAHSYELSLLSLAVWRGAPERWAAFDRWLFGSGVSGGGGDWPRGLAEARAQAVGYIGEQAVEAALSDPGHIAEVDRNISALGRVRDQSSGVMPRLPVVLSPYASRAVLGRFDEAGQLDALLEDARRGRP